MLGRPRAAAVAAIASSALLCSPAQAEGRFDGLWKTQVITEKGNCHRAYHVPVRIENGRPSYGGPTAFPFAGSISPRGAVRASITLGDSAANIVGQLSGKSGSG